MKNNKSFFLLLLVSIFSLNLFAQTGKLTKTIEGSYNVKSGSNLKLSTSFAQVEVEEWSKNTIEFKAVIEAESSDKKFTEKLLNSLEVKHNQEGNTVSIETAFANSNQKNSIKGKTSFGYKIKIFAPKGIIYNASVKFGNFKVPTIASESKVNVEFGSLVTNDVKKNAKLTVKFGGLQVNKIEDPTVDLEFASDKSVLKAVSGKSTINIRYSNAAVEISDISEGNININFSKVYLVTNKNLNSNLNLVSKFGNFNNSSNLNLTISNIDRNGQTKQYEYLNGKKVQIKTNAEFSTVFLSNEYPNESFFKSKDKNKLDANFSDLMNSLKFDEYIASESFKDLMQNVQESTIKALESSMNALKDVHIKLKEDLQRTTFP